MIGEEIGRTPSDRSDGALARLRVLDLATLFAAPSLAALLGDLGADVVKVEPPGGDPVRGVGAARDGHSLVSALVSRNKRSVTLDPARPAGLDVLAQLTKAADVVVVNQPSAVLERWRCTYPEIAERNPRAIVVSVSGYGTSGPYAGRAGSGTLAEAFAGLTHMTGEADGPPMLPSVPLGDCLAAMAGLGGVLAACYWRDTGGGVGQYVDVSMYEPIISLLGTAMVSWQPGTPPPRRNGSRVPGGVPRNTYRTSGGEWVVLSGTTDAQVARVLEVIGSDTAAARARYGRSEDRLKVADELDALVATWIGSHDTAFVVTAFERARVPVSRVNDLGSLTADPHVRSRKSVVTVENPDLGALLMPAPTPQLQLTPGRIRWPGGPPGAHTETVLREWLSLDDEKLESLRSDGAIPTEYSPRR